ncbi:MAG: hypothetical protein ACFBSD_01095 [Paracoccaceae bacterium]
MPRTTPRSFALVLCLAGLAVAGLAPAQETTSPSAEPLVDRQVALTEQIKTQVRPLGVTVGRVYACLEDGPERELMIGDAHVMYDLMTKSVGSDVAFVFATALGYGAASEAAGLDCPALAEAWQKIKVDFEIVDFAEADTSAPTGSDASDGESE